MEGPPAAPFADLSNAARMTSPETPAGKPAHGHEARGGAGGPGCVPARKHSPWTAARNKKKTKNALMSDDDDPMPCFSSPGELAPRRRRTVRSCRRPLMPQVVQRNAPVAHCRPLFPSENRRADAAAVFPAGRRRRADADAACR
jgi:hypothetical protein